MPGAASHMRVLHLSLAQTNVKARFVIDERSDWESFLAAGALPAVCAALRQHSGVAETLALCELAAERCSARGAPTGSRRVTKSMCQPSRNRIMPSSASAPSTLISGAPSCT